MNINDLKPGSYEVVAPLNVNTLPAGSVSPVQSPTKNSIWASLAKVPGKVVDTLGLRSATDVISDDINNIVHPKLMRDTNGPMPTPAQNIGAGAQLAAYITGGEGTFLKSLASGAIKGFAGFGGQAASEGDDFEGIAERGMLGALMAPGFVAGGKVIGKLGEGAYKFVIPRSAREAGMLQTYKAANTFKDRLIAAVSGDSKAPRTAADTAFDQGLWGTQGMLGVQAKRASTNLWENLVKPQLDNAEAPVSMPTFFKGIEEKIKKGTPELSRQKSLLEALDAMKEDYAGIDKVPLSQLQAFKEGWAEFVPDKAYQGKPIAGAFRDIQRIAASQARSTIYKTLGEDVKQAYFDYGNLTGLMALGKKAMTGEKLKGGFGGFWTAVKDMALTPIGTIGGHTIYKVGKGIELIGKTGAQIVGDLFDE